MEQYYIYLNGIRYMKLPKEFNIEHNVFIKSTPKIEQALNDWGHSAVCNWDGTIWIKKALLQYPRLHSTLKHELRHVKQMEESDIGRQIFLRKLQHPELKGPESYIGKFAKEVRRLRTGEELNFYDRYQLFRKLTSPEGRTVHTKHPYEVDAIKWQKREDIILKKALRKIRQEVK